MNSFSTVIHRFTRLALSLALGGASLGGHAQSYLTPDVSFGTSGSVDTALSGNGLLFSATTLEQPTSNLGLDFGQLLRAGNYLWVCGGNSGNFVVQRYLLNGQPDISFGTNGRVSTAFPSRAKATALAVQPDGKLVVVGAIDYGVPITFAAARYTPSGALDPSFGTGGLVFGASGAAPGTSPSPQVVLRRVVVLADGRILTAGNADGGAVQTRLLRLLPSGQLDTSFGAGSSALVIYNDLFKDLAVQPDGRILLFGNEARAGNPTGRLGTAVRSLTATGAPDPSFGTAGRTVINATPVYQGQPTTAFTELLSAVVQPADGKIVLAGWMQRLTSGPSIGTWPALLRLNADGTPDAAFNAATTGSITDISGLLAVALDAAGRVVVGGSISAFASTADQLLLARYSAAGVLDTTITRAANGRIVRGLYAETLPSGKATIRQIELLPGGNLLTLGGFGPANGLRLARYGFARPTVVRPADAALLGLQATPVPSTGPVQLRYTLPVAAAVRITLRDALGRLVVTVPAAAQAAGSQQLLLDLRAVAPGLYFCTLEAGTLRQTVRLVAAP